MVSFGSTIDPEILRCARALVTELEQHPFPGLLEFEASYTGVTVFYDPWCWPGNLPAGRSLAVQRISGSGGPGKDPAGRDPVHCGSGTGQDPDRCATE